MWLIPSTYSRSVAEPADSKSESVPLSNTSDSTRAFWVTVSGTATPRPSSWPGWKTRPWSRRLFGAATSPTWTPNLCEAASTSSLLDSPASRGQRPGSKKGPKTRDGSGPELRTSSARFDRKSSSWKMSRALFQEEGLNSCSVASPKCGSMRNGRISQRQALEPRTRGSGFSSLGGWPTIRANENGEYQNQRSGPAQPTLSGAAQNWGTPRVTTSAMTSSGNYDPAKSRLEDQAERMWATPAASDDYRGTTGYSEKQIEKGARILPHEVATWPTPAARDHKSGEASEATLSRNSRPLNELATHWPTPAATEGYKQPHARREGDRTLSSETASFSRPVQVTSTDGVELSPTDHSTSERRRLNPGFVCWLMGLPWWWTRAEPINFAAVAMASYRSKLQSHLSSLVGEPACGNN